MEQKIETLEPDNFEFKVAATRGLIPRCPFCGRWPLVHVTYNKNTEIYGGRVNCDAFKCGAVVMANARSREEARTLAIEKWSRRAK